MENTRAIAIQILNDANLCSQAQQKVGYLAQLTELLVRKEPGLLGEFLPEMATMQIDPSPSVRRALAQFLMEAAQVATSAEAFQQAATSVMALLADTVAAVLKAALLACHHVLRGALAVLAQQPGDAQAQKAVELAREAQQAATALINRSAGDALQLQALKFLECTILLYSGEWAPPLPGSGSPDLTGILPGALEAGHAADPLASLPPGTPPPARLPMAATLAQDAAAGCRTLADLLRPNTAKTGPGPLTLTAIRCAATIAGARPSLIGRLLPGLIALAKEGGYRASSDGTGPPVALGTRGSMLSLGNALRGALCAVLRGRAPASLPWRERVLEALKALGAEGAAEASLKYIQRQEYKEAKASKPHVDPRTPQGTTPHPGPGGVVDHRDAKRARTDGWPGAAGAAQPNPFSSAPPLLQPMRPGGVPPMPGAPQPHMQQSLIGGMVAAPTGSLPLPQPYPQPHLGPAALPMAVHAPPPPAPAAGPDVGGGAIIFPGQPPLTSPTDLHQLTVVVPALVTSSDPSLLPAFLDSLAHNSPVVLADIVTSLIFKHEVPPPAEMQAALDRHAATSAGGAFLRPPAPPPGAPPGYQAPPPGTPGTAAVSEATAAGLVNLLAALQAAIGGGPGALQGRTSQGGAPDQAAGPGRALPAPLSSRGPLTGPAVEAARRLPKGQSALPRELPLSPAAAALLSAASEVKMEEGAPAAVGPVVTSKGPAAVAAAAAGPAAPISTSVPASIASALQRGAPLVAPARLSHEACTALRLSALRRLAAGLSHADGSHLPAPVSAKQAGQGLLPPHAAALQESLLARLAASLAAAAAEAAAAEVEAAQQGRSTGSGGGARPGASATAAGEAAAGIVIEAALAAIAAGRGHGLALKWLTCLLAEHCSRVIKGADEDGDEEMEDAGGLDGPEGPLMMHASEMDVDGKDGGEGEDKKKVGEEEERQQAPGTEQAQTAGGGDESEPAIRVKQEPGAMISVKKKDEEEEQQPADEEAAAAAAAAAAGEAEQRQAPRRRRLTAVRKGRSQGVSEEGTGEGDGMREVSPLELSGTLYESALLSLLDTLKQGERWREARALLADAPALPIPGALVFLGEVISSGGEAATAGLGAIREAVMDRPALRGPLLELALRAAADPDPSTRSKAVRLCCNQLGLVPGLGPLITAAAQRSLKSLLGPPPEETGAPEWSQEEAARHCELYTTLCVRTHSLLPGLMEAYAAAPAAVRAALLGASDQLAKALGHSNPHLLALVRKPVPGSEPLVQHMLEVLSATLLPSEAMMAAVRDRVMATGDVAILSPVVAALEKGEVLNLLPRLLQVPGVSLKGLYRKLASANAISGDVMFSPAELLVALHGLDPGRDGIPPRSLMTAVDTALHTPDVFPQTAVAQALETMAGFASLPLLFMRSIITAIKAAPRLQPFIQELLGRLMYRQPPLWLDPSQWRGMLMLIDNNGRPYFPLLLQLPPTVLEAALGLGPASQDGSPPLSLKRPTALQLASWATSPACKIQVVRPVQALLERVLESHRAEVEAAEKAAADAAAAIAAAQAAASGTTVSAAPAPAAVAGAEGVAAGPGPEGADTAQPRQVATAAAPAAGGADVEAEGTLVAEEGPEAHDREVDEFDLDFEALAEEEEAEGGEGQGKDVAEEEESGAQEGPG